jgi:serine/threonine protein kinase
MNTPEAFGKYVLMDRVAIGGMAEIFRARKLEDPSQREICVKRILPHYSEDESFINMFIDEASIAAKLQHPNIVQIYDFDIHDGSYYIAMELVNGRDLKQSLELCSQKATQLSVEMIMVITAALGRALHYAHTREENGQPLNIVHRDVSPHNVLLGFNGDVKLTDFGIAKAASRITTTRAGTVKGKCAYMSPEQARGKTLDGRSDIFSIGILMYEMLCNRRLFTGESDFDILTKVLKEDITPPSAYRLGLDPEVERICLKALERDRNLRYASGAAMEADCQAWIAQKLGGDISRAGIGRFMQTLFGVSVGNLPQSSVSYVPQDVVAVADMKTAAVDPTALGLGAPSLQAKHGDIHSEKTSIGQSAMSQNQDDDDETASRTEAINYDDVMASMQQAQAQAGRAQQPPQAGRAAQQPAQPQAGRAAQQPQAQRQPAPAAQPPQPAKRPAPEQKKGTPWLLILGVVGFLGFMLLATLAGGGYYLYAKTDFLTPYLGGATADAGTPTDGADAGAAANDTDASEDTGDDKNAAADDDKDAAEADAAQADKADAGEADAGDKDADGLAANAGADAGPADAGDKAPPEEAPTGSLSLTSKPSGATVFLDGVEHLNKTPTTLDKLPLNKEVKIRLVLEGYEDLESTYTLAKDKDKTDLKLTKKKEEPKEDDQAAKDKAAEDKAAKEQAAKDKAAKDKAEKDKAAKEQAAKDKAEKDRLAKEKKEKELADRLKADKGKDLKVDDKKVDDKTLPKGGTGTLSINALPWAEVTVDGKAAGRTPVTKTVSAGKHTITFKNPDKKEVGKQSVTVGDGEKKSVFHRFK